MPGALSIASAKAWARRPCSITDGRYSSLFDPTPAILNGALQHSYVSHNNHHDRSHHAEVYTIVVMNGTND